MTEPQSPTGYWTETDEAIRESNALDRDAAREINAETFGAPPFGSERMEPPC